jgi:DNA repair exonuclease SbcCD ATPase subunit
MNISSPPRFGFPCVERVQLHDFSLYSREPNTRLALDSGVTCLAGANGIGKSTFLCTVNFALTGAIPEPSRDFLSAPAYFAKAKEYASTFFEGRINETDRDTAAVTVSFTVRKRQYSVKRALFSVGAIEELRICEDGVLVHNSEDATAEQNDEYYRADLCKAIGLNSFEQFVMLQHFLFTFDESRHLVFWDRPASAALLYVCFGGDPHDAARADHLNREMERAGSRGRNYQFQATNLTKRIDTLEASVKGTTENSLEGDQAEAKYRELTAAVDKATAESDEAEALVSEAELKVIDANAEVLNRRAAYEKAFERFMLGSATPDRHPLITSAIADCHCPVCRNDGEHVAQAIRARLEAKLCPICASTIQPTALDPAVSDQLSQLDLALAQAKRALDAATDAKARIERAAAAKREAVKSTREAMRVFEESNRAVLEGIQGRLALLDGPLAETLEAFRKARQDLSAQRDLAYAERDRFRDDLRSLQRNLEQKYIEAESQFVPKFKSLAKAFLGVDLDITLVTGGAIGLHLQIEMRGNARRKESQLSESQRFFVDIALRMALAQYVSDPDSRAMLFIDTPEGSLDIAYEDRAGQMFAEFVKSGHALLMTANINSSKLLTTLAKVCTSESMTLVQMTHWTELSDVQQRASDLFRDAFADINSALGASV